MAIPTMSLKAINFNPIAFTPSEYKFQPADMTFLEKSLAQREARMEKASQARSAVDKVLGEIEMTLNPTESKWFEDYKQNIKDQIQYNVDAGNYGAAFRTATELAGSVINDPRILGRKRSQQAYKTEVETQKARRDRGEISQNTFDWWYAKNQYKYNDAKDDKGNYIEGSMWQADTRPTKDINWAEDTAVAFKLITAKKGTTNRAGGEDTTNIDGTGNLTRWHDKESFENVTEQDILDNLEELVGWRPDGYRQIEQAYAVFNFDTKRLENELATLSLDDPRRKDLNDQIEVRQRFTHKNGSSIGYKEYYARMILNNRFAGTLAYDYKTTDTAEYKGNDYQPNITNPNLNNPNPDNEEHIGAGHKDWQGPNVRAGSYTPGETYEYSSSINGRFAKEGNQESNQGQ